MEAAAAAARGSKRIHRTDGSANAPRGRPQEGYVAQAYNPYAVNAPMYNGEMGMEEMQMNGMSHMNGMGGINGMGMNGMGGMNGQEAMYYPAQWTQQQQQQGQGHGLPQGQGGYAVQGSYDYVEYGY